jgi:hypothetical protein
MRRLLHVARGGLHAVVTRPGLIAAFYAINLALTALVGWLVASPLAALWGQHPPNAWAWAVVLNAGSPALPALGMRIGAAMLVYGVLAAWPVAAGVSLLAHSRWVFALGRPAVRVLFLRCLTGIGLASVALGWALSARWGYRESLGFSDERLMWSTQVAIAFPCAVALATASLLGHFAQILVIARRLPPLAAIKQALSLIRRHRTAAIGSWLCKWITVILLTSVALSMHGWIAAPIAVSVLSQLTVCLKVAAALWAWAAGIVLAHEGFVEE